MPLAPMINITELALHNATMRWSTRLLTFPVHRFRSLPIRRMDPDGMDGMMFCHKCKQIKSMEMWAMCFACHKMLCGDCAPHEVLMCYKCFCNNFCMECYPGKMWFCAGCRLPCCNKCPPSSGCMKHCSDVCARCLAHVQTRSRELKCILGCLECVKEVDEFEMFPRHGLWKLRWPGEIDDDKTKKK